MAGLGMISSQAIMAQVKFSTVVATKEAGLDEMIQVEYIVQNARSADNFIPPAFKGFKVVQGPFQSISTSNINGVSSSSQSISYILQPEAVGRFTIEGATATIDGKNMRSNAVTVQINKKGTGGGQKNIQPLTSLPFMDEFFEDRSPVVEEDDRLRPGENAKEKIAKNVMVKLDVNKTSCYEGEPVMATYKLCSRLRMESAITRKPSFNGFSVYDMTDPSDRPFVEKINGKDFLVQIFRRAQLFPLQAGSYTLEPLELENKIQFLRVNPTTASRGRSMEQRLLENLYGSQEEGEVEVHTVDLSSKPVTINVKPLPDKNKPADFKGAVGKFTLQAELKNKTIATEDAALLEVAIQGTGNLPVINAPNLALPAGMEAFDPVVKENIDKTVYPLQGSKTFAYTFIAHDTGSFTIPAVQFSYFDPAASSYKTVHSDPFVIRVLKGTKSYSSAAAIATAQKVKTPPAVQGWKDIFSSLPFLLSLIAVLLIIVIYLLVKNRTPRNVTPQPEVAIAKPVAVEEPAKAATPDPLQAAKLALHLGHTQEFYGEINRVIRNVAALKGETLSSETIQEMDAIKRECEIALYTPGYEEKDRRDLLEKATKIIHSLYL